MRPGNPGAAADQLASIRLEDETDPVVAKIERLADLMWNSEVRRLRIRCPTVPAGRPPGDVLLADRGHLLSRLRSLRENRHRAVQTGRSLPTSPVGLSSYRKEFGLLTVVTLIGRQAEQALALARIGQTRYHLRSIRAMWTVPLRQVVVSPLPARDVRTTVTGQQPIRRCAARGAAVGTVCSFRNEEIRSLHREIEG